MVIVMPGYSTIRKQINDRLDESRPLAREASDLRAPLAL
jgi:hypothetical protein